MTGKYAFSFTTILWDHEWDGCDYAYIHDVGEKEGGKMYRLLSERPGMRGKTMGELLRAAFGGDPDAVLEYCAANGIEYTFCAITL